MQRRFRRDELRITRHVLDRIKKREFTLDMLYAALENAEYTYESKKYPGQLRLVKGDMCVAVDTIRRSVPTAFFNGRLDPNWQD